MFATAIEIIWTERDWMNPLGDGSAGNQPNAHGGRSSRGFIHRAKNIHSKLSTPIDPDLDGVGVHVDIPDLVDRFQNGNQFNVGANVDGKTCS
ncbi:unnamed protein product [Rotaria magnacalcarata]|uniref:Uncharacterized protein n=1 Tax=Rotaria magnacalcarata TaxID=392030 RepID=A0A816MG56_9BILA|nr:unnamed protein product [Rotaria magnacalcarata]